VGNNPTRNRYFVSFVCDSSDYTYSQSPGSSVIDKCCLGVGSAGMDYYAFTIRDAYGDGLCCENGSGEYTVEVDGSIVVDGSSTGDSAAALFDDIYSTPFYVDDRPLMQPTSTPPPTA